MKEIPDFPKKRALCFQDKPLLDDLFRKNPPSASEYTFTNLFAWQEAYSFSLSRLHGCILIISRTKAGNISIFDPLCSNEKKLKLMTGAAQIAGEKVQFVRLPYETAQLLKASKAFNVKEDRDQFDYVYRSKDLILLQGTAYDGKRNFVRRFKENNEFEFRELSESDIEDCLYFEEEWCRARDCREGLARERQAIRRMLENFKKLGSLKGAMIRIKGKIEAVTLGEELNPDTLVVHIEKANGAFTGIYQAINQMFCEHAARDYEFVNREQDLGVPGLRQAKTSYHPCFMVKKYTASLL